MLKFLIEKEFTQFRRKGFLPKLIIVMPLMYMLVFPWLATMDIQNLNVVVVDRDRSVSSDKLIKKIDASSYFSLYAISYSYEEGLNFIENDEADLILDIPVNYEKKLCGNENPMLCIIVNSVNGTKGMLGGSYMSAICSEFKSISPKKVSVINLYNPMLNYKEFMIPAFLVILVMMLCGFLPALNIVSERELGTIEQINVTPVGKFKFVFAKLIPYWVIGFVVITLCFIISNLVYGYSPKGSFIVIYLATAIFVLVMSSLGLVVSNYSQTMQQSMMVMFFFVLIFNLMSGLFTPVRSMPEWAQWLSAFCPPKYYVEIMRGVFQKGSNIIQLWENFSILFVFALVFGFLSIVSYKKRN